MTFQFKLFVRKTVDVEELGVRLKREISLSEARCAPGSVSPPSLQMVREMKSWCPSGQRTVAWGGIGQPLFQKGKSVARAVGGFVYKLLSCCYVGPVWLMRLSKLTDFQMQLREAFSTEVFICCIC